MFLPQNSMFRNFYLVKSCKIFLKTQKFSRKLKILTSKLKLSELSSTLGFQSGVKKSLIYYIIAEKAASRIIRSLRLPTDEPDLLTRISQGHC